MSKRILSKEVVDENGVKADFDYKDRKLWLRKIHLINYEAHGNSNYSYDQTGTYMLEFHINDGSDRRAYRASECYYLRVCFQIDEWCRPEEDIKQELLSILDTLPEILYKDDVVNAFRYRNYYR